MIARLVAYVRGIARRRHAEAELDEELRFHLEHEIDAHVARGLSPADARRTALRDLGGLTQTTEAVRAVRTFRLESIWRDVTYGARRLRRERGFAVAAILTLALGIGANTAIFSIVNALMLRTLPVPRPDRLVRLTPGGQRLSWSYPLWEQLRDRQTAFEGVVAWSTRGVHTAGGPAFDLSAGGPTDLVNGLWVSGGFFDVLGLQAVLGRTIAPADDVKGGGIDGPVAVISYAFWQTRFKGAHEIIGTPISIERVPFTIVGVTPPGFSGPNAGEAFDVAIPLGAVPLVYRRDRLVERTWWWLTVMGRLKEGETHGSAAAALATQQPHMRDATRPPNMRPEDAADYLKAPFAVTLSPAGPSSVREAYRQPLGALMSLVAVVLLIACVNIGNLLLARAATRRHEISLRLAIGASRARIVGQLLVESLLLSVAGAAVGLAMASWASRWLVSQFSVSGGAAFLDLSLDLRVLGFTAALSVAVALVFGLLPAFRATALQPIHTIKERTAAGGGHSLVRGALVSLQVALCLVLVVGAGLFVRTFTSLTRQHPGFDADRILVVNVDARGSARHPSERLALYTRLVESVRALPGVAHASFSAVTPVSDNEWDTIIENPAGLSLAEEDRRVFKNIVSPGWFATYGMPLLAGRDLGPSDLTPEPAVAVVNEAFARRYFEGRSPIGRTVRELGDPAEAPALTIVGVVKDAVYLSLREAPPPTMYLPAGFGSGALSIRAEGVQPASLIPGVTSAIVALDRDLAVTLRPLASDLRAFVARERMLALLSGFFGGLALLLAGLGLYGVVSYDVGSRRPEIGIRMALGATPGAVVRLVLRGVTMQVCAGVVGGVVASLWVTRFASALLFDVAPRDPVTLASAIGILVAVAVVAGWLPARRATGVDPATTLRAE